MRRSIVAILLIAALISGCAHAPTPRTLESVSSSVEGKRGDIALFDGRTVSGRDIRVSPASVSWTNDETGLRESVPTADVYEIRVPCPGRGVLRGLGRGCLMGGAIGVAVGAVAGSGGGCVNELATSDKDCAMLGGLAGGIFGGAAGGLVGAIRGLLTEKDVYQIRNLPKPDHERTEANDEQ